MTIRIMKCHDGGYMRIPQDYMIFYRNYLLGDFGPEFVQNGPELIQNGPEFVQNGPEYMFNYLINLIRPRTPCLGDLA